MSDSNRLPWLRNLSKDPNYKRWVRDPIDKQRKVYEQVVRDHHSSVEDIRFAQGALKVLDWHNYIFEHNEIEIAALERKKENANGRERKPNYTEGRYCT